MKRIHTYLLIIAGAFLLLWELMGIAAAAIILYYWFALSALLVLFALLRCALLETMKGGDDEE